MSIKAKPQTWRPRRHLVAPKWAHIWDVWGPDAIVLPLMGTAANVVGRDAYELKNGASWIDTKFGQGVNFDGTDDMIYIGSGFNPSGFSSITFGVFFIPAGTVGVRKVWQSWSDSPNDRHFLVRQATDLRVAVSTTSGIVTSDGGTATTGQPVYVVGRFEQSVALGLFVDGVLVNEETSSGNLSAPLDTKTPRTKLGAGGTDTVHDDPFPGQVLLAWATPNLFDDEQIREMSDLSDAFGSFERYRRPRGRVIVATSAIDVTPAAVSEEWNVVNPTTTFGAISVTPGAESETWAIVNPADVTTGLDVTPDAVSEVWQLLAPGTTFGGISVTPDAISEVWTAVAPSVTLGALSVTPAAESETWSIVNPTLTFGAVLVTPDAESETWTAVAGSATVGQSVTPFAQSETWTTVNPTITLGALSVTPAAVSEAWDLVSPSSVTFGAISVAPAARGEVWAQVNPTVTTGVEFSGVAVGTASIFEHAQAVASIGE